MTTPDSSQGASGGTSGRSGSESMIREAKKQYIIKLQNLLIDKSIPPGKWWRIAKSVSKFKSTNTTNMAI
jgi:hypothetical protein